MTSPREESAAAALASHNGACHVTNCGCPVYLPNGKADGFEICTCLHTRWSH